MKVRLAFFALHKVIKERSIGGEDTIAFRQRRRKKQRERILAKKMEEQKFRICRGERQEDLAEDHQYNSRSVQPYSPYGTIQQAVGIPYNSTTTGRTTALGTVPPHRFLSVDLCVSILPSRA